MQERKRSQNDLPNFQDVDRDYLSPHKYINFFPPLNKDIPIPL